MSAPLFMESVWRSNARRDERLPRRAIWSLASRFIWNCLRLETASHYAEHLAIAAHVLSVPSQTGGCVIECGCYKGGSTANLSLASALTGRELHVFDSFEGLPTPVGNDEENVLHHDSATNTYARGMYAGSLEEVRENVRRGGDLDVCHFHKGWFEDTLLDFSVPCVAAFVDVDLRGSLETCVEAIWPLMTDGAALFAHEARHHEIASLFYDDPWWQGRLGVPAPGFVGAGTGLGLSPASGGWVSQLGYARKSAVGGYEPQRG